MVQNFLEENDKWYVAKKVNISKVPKALPIEDFWERRHGV